MRSTHAVVLLVVSLLLALVASLIFRAKSWSAIPPLSNTGTLLDESSQSRNQTQSAQSQVVKPLDFEIIPISSDQSNASSNVELQILPGLGGATTAHGQWNGYAVIATRLDGNNRTDALFSVLPPKGGCTAESGHLEKTSLNAKRNGCLVAVNGSPFTKGGGCIGESISSGNEVCEDCGEFDGIPSIGMAKSSWIIGTGINYSVAKSLGIRNLMVGHVPGWLIRNGTILVSPSFDDSLAPRTAVGVTKDGRNLILLVVDGCEHCPGFIGGAQGLTVRNLALQMKRLGADYAINLDGGGSSTMFYGGKVVNYPTSLDVPIWRERKISTVLCLRPFHERGRER